MSDDQDDEPEPAQPDEDHGPELDDDDYLDIDADMAADVADETADEAEQEDADQEEDSTGADAIAPTADVSSSSTAGTSVGDIYCNALGMGAAVSRVRYGTLDEAERDAVREEYADMARDLEIDTYVDEWMVERGGMDELSPGQAIMVSTGLFGAFVAMDDPALVEALADGGA